MRPLILIADDNADNRAIMAAILTAAGFRVAEAADGAAAVAEAGRRKPDLVLLDLSMPVLDGYGAARAIRSDPGTAGTPILAWTAFALAGDDAKARAAGCDGYISKPCLPADVLRRIGETLLARRRDHARVD
ncbi:MAG: response regulator [Elusimicrobia bacterium]|nr:response regulator [Elusimicrobiota bacterium]